MIAIVTDSTCDIPFELAVKYHIHVVPNILVINGQDFEDEKDISREEFYNRLPSLNEIPTTAAPASGVYQKLYQQLLEGGASHILSIHASSLLSGIYNAARIAAQPFGERITVVDSKMISLGLGYQALAAAEAADKGLSLETILSKLHDLRSRTRVAAMLDTLEYVRRGGRVSWVRARLGNILNIKPLIEVKDGKVLSLGEVRTRSKGVKRLVEIMLNSGPLECLAILHSNAEEEATQLISQLSLPTQLVPLVVNVTPVIGAHVGPNALGFACVVA